MQVAEVWLNKTKLATNYCGYLPFVVDLTRSANFGPAQNILSVRLDNRDNPHVPPGKPQNQLDFTYFGGLYRNVRLDILDRLHIVDPILEDKIGGGGVFVTFSNVTRESATVSIRTDVRNEHLHPVDCRLDSRTFRFRRPSRGQGGRRSQLRPGDETDLPPES